MARLSEALNFKMLFLLKPLVISATPSNKAAFKSEALPVTSVYQSGPDLEEVIISSEKKGFKNRGLPLKQNASCPLLINYTGSPIKVDSPIQDSGSEDSLETPKDIENEIIDFCSKDITNYFKLKFPRVFFQRYRFLCNDSKLYIHHYSRNFESFLESLIKCRKDLIDEFVRLHYNKHLELFDMKPADYYKWFGTTISDQINNPYEIQLILDSLNKPLIRQQLSIKIDLYEIIIQNLTNLTINAELLANEERGEFLKLMSRISNGLILLLEEIFLGIDENSCIFYIILNCLKTHLESIRKFPNLFPEDDVQKINPNLSPEDDAQKITPNLSPEDDAQKIKKMFIINCRAIKLIISAFAYEENSAEDKSEEIDFNKLELEASNLQTSNACPEFFSAINSLLSKLDNEKYKINHAEKLKGILEKYHNIAMSEPPHSCQQTVREFIAIGASRGICSFFNLAFGYISFKIGYCFNRLFF